MSTRDEMDYRFFISKYHHLIYTNSPNLITDLKNGRNESDVQLSWTLADILNGKKILRIVINLAQKRGVNP